MSTGHWPGLARGDRHHNAARRKVVDDPSAPAAEAMVPELERWSHAGHRMHSTHLSYQTGPVRTPLGAKGSESLWTKV